MKIIPYGDRALLMNWAQRIDPGINTTVLAWKQAIEEANLRGVAYTIPAYCSLTVVFNPLEVAFESLKAQLESLKVEAPNSPAANPAIEIPIVYDGADLPEVSQATGLSKTAIIEQHSSQVYRVYMIGFLPGFPYLGPLPEALHCPRKASPRKAVPAGSVGLAGAQTGIYPFEAPGGWQLIGHTPRQVFDPAAAAPFLLRAGDSVRFQPI